MRKTKLGPTLVAIMKEAVQNEPPRWCYSCCYITNDKVCGKNAVDAWRVLAMAPQKPVLQVLVPLCRKHGGMTEL